MAMDDEIQMLALQKWDAPVTKILKYEGDFGTEEWAEAGKAVKMLRRVLVKP